MKNNQSYSFVTGLSAVIMTTLLSQPAFCQNEEQVIKTLLQKLPQFTAGHELHKYKMTTVYINRDLYGNFTGKTKVTGEYTCGLNNDNVLWNNVFISGSDKNDEIFPEGIRQEYMESFSYSLSSDMLKHDAFENFPAGPEAVLAKNLVWDMRAIESFAMKYTDSLSINKIYTIPGGNEQFNMADIGTYTHNKIQISWTGISAVDEELCGIIDFRAIDNKIEMKVEPIKTRGTEQYWGTIWISLKTGLIEHAVMYSGTIQEIEITGMETKILAKTIRDLRVDKIQ